MQAWTRSLKMDGSMPPDDTSGSGDASPPNDTSSAGDDATSPTDADDDMGSFSGVEPDEFEHDDKPAAEDEGCGCTAATGVPLRWR